MSEDKFPHDCSLFSGTCLKYTVGVQLPQLIYPSIVFLLRSLSFRRCGSLCFALMGRTIRINALLLLVQGMCRKVYLLLFIFHGTWQNLLKTDRNKVHQ